MRSTVRMAAPGWVMGWCALWLAPAAAAAQTPDEIEEARSIFERATQDYREGRFDDAWRGFTRAHELTGAPELLYNAGAAAERLGRDGDALVAYEAYLASLPEGAERAEVEARVRRLRELTRAEPPAQREEEGVTTHAPEPLAAALPPARESLVGWAVAAWAAALVGALGWGVAGGLALSEYEHLSSACRSECDLAGSPLPTLNVLADASFAWTAAAATAAAVLTVVAALDAEDGAPVALAPWASPGALGVLVAGRL
ncbi:MAG: hypothetical protein KF729_33505 [Sandaracinaceae bacterium]|nr:hypothetical protein [Sandaracinaceae bacterium]